VLKFWAILKDSFREAVDGKIFLVMLIISTLLIVFVASFSVEPVDADEAFSHITHQFVIVSPDRGHSTTGQRPFFYLPETRNLQKTNDATAPQQGDYRFVLHITDVQVEDNGPVSAKDKEKDKDKDRDSKESKEEKAKQDRQKSQFLQAVAYWLSVPKFSDMTRMAEPDTSSITDDDILAFVRSQFESYGDMDLAKLSRRPSTEKGIYEFDVETKGLKGAKGWPHNPRLFFGLWKPTLPLSLGTWMYLIEGSLVSDVGATIAMLIGVVITAFFVPNMMRKGAIDLMLSKPVSRVSLLIYKYIGGLTFVFLTTAYCLVGIWLVLGMRTGMWGTGVLFVILTITFYFAILYSVSTVTAVLTKNTIVAILVTLGFWGLMFVVGFGQNRLQQVRDDKTLGVPKGLINFVDFLNTVLPRTTDLDNLMTKLIVDDDLGRAEKIAFKKDKLKYPAWGEVIGVSMGYIVVLLGLSCWRFSTRDY